MKINPKIYNAISTTPFDVQKLEDDVVIELHSLNENEDLYNAYAPKAKFAVWSTLDGKTYRLLLEDTYYPRLREFYGKRVNKCMIEFWEKVEKGRSKLMKFVFVPVAILVFIAFILLLILGKNLDQNLQTILIMAILIAFIITNTVVNKKIDNLVNKHNNEAVEKIKNIIGHKRFEELQNETQAHYDEFFGIEEEPVEEVTEEEKPTEE